MIPTIGSLACAMLYHPFANSNVFNLFATKTLSVLTLCFSLGPSFSVWEHAAIVAALPHDPKTIRNRFFLPHLSTLCPTVGVYQMLDRCQLPMKTSLASYENRMVSLTLAAAASRTYRVAAITASFHDASI